MKLKLHILFILLLGLSTGEIQAQVSLAFSDDVFYQDTVLLNSTQEFSLELMNTGEDTLLEPVEIFMSITNFDEQTTTESMGMFIPQDTVFVPGGVLEITFIDLISPEKYSAGDNVVVIWPGVTATPITHETYTGFVYVKEFSGVGDLNVQQLNMYPNPMQEQAVLSLPSNEWIESVKVLNVMGAIVREERVKANQYLFSKEELSKGVYFLEVFSKEAIYQQKIIIN